MTHYIALLRGINVGGNNIIKMAALRDACSKRGLENVSTYINSGNILFCSQLAEDEAKSTCERLIQEEFALDIPVCVMPAAELVGALAHAPKWWNALPDAKHDAFFVIPPMTAAEICAHIGDTREEYEQAAHHSRVIFWSAPLATFSRTRWSKLSKDKAMYRAITVRNANTTLKLAELVKDAKPQPSFPT